MDRAKVVAKHSKIVKFAAMKLHANIVNPAMFLIMVFANFAAQS